ncbi:PLDc N-terminal domain-containing protein [Alkalibacillus sp. S2W]|uniref:PLDc N-terminal domain-containing protein n=1 Tax=Alkalibacillus TaxID=331654 RepID=UPI00141DAA1A|nr:PLDc N-terminal domain-containing protein [Alkalibacillus almallahensis]NIK13323.1 pilus assembly protein TadC [Alkalibacillus almallahensis]
MILDFSIFAIIIFLLFGLGLLILNIVTSIWSYRDAKRKGKSNEYAMIVLFGTLFLPVMGFIVYLIIRND